jgi:hypothetical protein
VVFFESNGGMTRTEATLPEIRLAVAEPELDIANVETVLESLSENCYFLTSDRNRYRFSSSPRLNKVLSDRRASVKDSAIEERVRQEIQNVFKSGTGIPERIYFPEQTGQVPDRPVLTLLVCKPEQTLSAKNTLPFIEKIIRECGSTGRTFKSALLFAVPDNPTSLQEEARKLLALEDISDDSETLKRLDESDKKQLKISIEKSSGLLKDAVWRTYRFILLLGKDNKLREIDLGLTHSSSADNIKTAIMTRLDQDDEVVKGFGPAKLLKNWVSFEEWSTKSVRDAFYSSPQLPRLLSPEIVKDTIARGVSDGLLAYVGKSANGDYEPFYYGTALSINDIEFSDDMFIITKDTAEKYKRAKQSEQLQQQQPTAAKPDDHKSISTSGSANTSEQIEFQTTEAIAPGSELIGQPNRVVWQGEIPYQKWMNFYTKVISKFASEQGLKLTLKFEVSSEKGISTQKAEEAKIALRELGVSDDLQIF